MLDFRTSLRKTAREKLNSQDAQGKAQKSPHKFKEEETKNLEAKSVSTLPSKG